MFRLQSSNGTFWREATVVVSTIEIPRRVQALAGYAFETCLFADGNSEVIETYDNMQAAIEGHGKYRRALL